MNSATDTGDAAPSLRERRRAQTREDLVAGVLAVIDAQGFDRLTIERIATAAGVSRGTVYAHFPGGLTELVSAAYAEIGRTIVARTTAEIAAVSVWTEELTAHARAMFDFAASSGCGHFYNVSGPAFISAGESRGIGTGASRAMIADTLAQAQAAGRLREAIVPEAVATLLVGAIREAAIAIATGEADPAEELAAFSTLVAGLAAPH